VKKMSLKQRKSWIGVALICVVGCLGCSAKNRWALKTDGMDPKTDRLWLLAVELNEKNNNWIAGKLVMTWKSVVLNKTAGSEEMWVQNSPDQDGKVKSEVIKLLKDGQEVSSVESQKKMEDLSKSAITGGVWFSKRAQKKVLIERMNLKTPRQEKTCEGYRFQYKGKGEQVTHGSIWLEENTGKPVEGFVTFRPLPLFATDLQATITYDVSSDEYWRIKSIKMEIELIVGKAVAELSFSDYWKKESKEKV
jgi:hypothetical protein